MEAKKPSLQEAKELYYGIRSPKFDHERFASKPEASVVVKLAKNCSEDEFIEFTQSGHLPALKLTAHEMQLMKGGLTPIGVMFLIVGGACLVGATFLSDGHH
jgi:hypothetical protein